MKRTLHVFRWLIVSFCAGVFSHTTLNAQDYFLENPSAASAEEFSEWSEEFSSWREGFGQHYWPAGDGTAGFYPIWSFFVDAVYLDRQAYHRGTMLNDDSFQPLLTTTDLNLQPDAGVRLGAAVYEMDGWELELQALLLGPNDRLRTFSAAGGVQIAPGVAVAPFDTATYASEFYSGEFNIRRRILPQFTLLTGLRIATLEEDLAVFQSSSTSTRMDVSLDNDLVGWQFGAEAMIFSWRRIHLFGSMKYGIFANHMELNGSSSAVGAFPAVAVNWRDSEIATLGEAVVGLEIPLGPHGSFRIGYQALWLQGMGLAVDQNYLSLLAGGSGIQRSNTTYHGGFLGVELAF